MKPTTKIKRTPHTEERKRNIGLSRQVKLPEEQMLSLKGWWSLGYVTGSYIKRELKIGDRVYNRLLAEYCEQEQIQFLPQNLEPETYEHIIQKCKDGVPYVSIAEELGLKRKQVRLIIQKLATRYDIKPLSKPMGNHCEEHRAFLAGQLAEYNKQNPKKKEQNPNWKGGITEISDLIRVTKTYKEWRLSVFKRDGFKCIICGTNQHLHADHIYPFSLLLHEGMIKTVEQAETHAPLWNLANGRTMCETCHRKTETYGRQRKTN
jgi:5-methylcytosine-specific restriction endonuclease McrA